MLNLQAPWQHKLQHKMSDPITASIQIAEFALTAIKTVVAVATWWGTRQANKSPDTSFGTGFYRQRPEDLLYVMATLGQWMVPPDAINVSVLPAAAPAVRRAFEAGDPDDDDLGEIFDSMDVAVQYTVTSGMVFCAE